jgi:alpha-tubulin suppressor-like RCC1 family protein
MITNNKGFSHVEVFFTFIIIAVIGLIGFAVDNHPVTAKVAAQSSSNNSEVYGWGSYLGGTSPGTLKVPTPIGSLSSIVSINAANSSDLALQCVGGKTTCSTDGTVWAWGNNNNGQLGNGSTSNSLKAPAQVQFPAGTHIVSIGEADNDGYAIDSTGQGWGWGLNGNGSLCIGNTQQQSTPVKISSMQNAVSVQGGQGHVLWLLANGTVETCGHNNLGQLGDGNNKNSYTPVAVNNLNNIVQISAGNRSSAAVDSNGNLYMWGDNAFGRLGICSSASSENTPMPVSLPAPVKEVSAGGSETDNGSTMVLLNNNSVYAWGNNTWGQLDNGNTTNQSCPVAVNLPANTVYTSVVAGGSTSFGLDSTGNVWAWGLGSGYRLGNGQTGSSNVAYTPIKVDSGVDMISATASNAIDHHTAQ